jgi:signal peptidase I
MTELSQRLSDVQASTIFFFAAALTVIRFLLIKRPGTIARSSVEIVDAALFTSVLMFMIIFPFGFKAFFIPSPSMYNTLIEDDRILVNKFEYRYERPKRSDVVVFNAPPEAFLTSGEPPDPSGAPTDYIKRLIGLPGDTIEVHAGVIKVGLNAQEKVFTHSGLKELLNMYDKSHEHIKFFDHSVQTYDGSKYATYTKEQIAQIVGMPGQPAQIVPGYVLRNGQRLNEPYIAEDPDYDLKFDAQGNPVKRTTDGLVISMGGASKISSNDFDKFKSEKIPTGRVVVFGDNRNESNDSSMWGTLDETRLIGRAFLIFYPLDRIRNIR